MRSKHKRNCEHMSLCWSQTTTAKNKMMVTIIWALHLTLVQDQHRPMMKVVTQTAPTKEPNDTVRKQFELGMPIISSTSQKGLRKQTHAAN